MADIKTVLQEMINIGEDPIKIQEVADKYKEANPGWSVTASIEDDPIAKSESQKDVAVTEDVTASNGEESSTESVQDRIVQPNIVVPEIDPNATLNSEDFYSKQEGKNEDDPLLEIGKEKVDTTIDPATGEKWTKEAAIANMKLKGKKSASQKPKNLIKEDEETLKAWLNVEYFGKGTAQKVIGNKNLTAYQDENPGEGVLEQDFKSNLGKLGIDRSAFPSLTDGDLDNIFAEVLNSKVRAEKGSISKGNQYTAVNNGLKNGIPIEDNVKNLSTLKINTNENKSEAKYAQAVQRLRGELTETERKALERDTRLDLPGSYADLAFNEDEMKYDPLTRRMMPTGKRIPKDIGFKKFHDPKTGRNLNAKEREAVEANGGTTTDITDAYQSYLNSYENTSQDDLAKYNDQLLLEEAGYNIEGKKTGDYYVGDKIMRNTLTKQGYKTDVENPDIFKDVPLSALTQLSHVPGKSDFWSPDISMAKGEVIPQSFEGMPYENEEEFLDMLRVRRNQGNDIAAKNAALWDVHYLNRDPSTINKSRGGQFMGAFANSMFGEQITDEQFSQSGQDIVDVISQQIAPDSGVDISKQQEESFERTFMDKLNEGAGGMTAMLATLTPINKLDKALRISKSIMALSAPRYVNAAGKSIRQAQAIKKAAKQGKNVDDWAEAAGYTMVKASNLQKGVGLAALGVYEDIKMKEVLGGLTDGRMEFERGVGFGFALGPKLLPFGFGRFAKGKKYNLSTKSTQMNTFLQSTFVNGGSFAMAVESGDLIGAVVKDLQGKKEFETWAHHHWSDRDENMSRIGLNIITGKALGLKNFDYMDFKTTTQVGEFKRQSVELAEKDLERIDKLAEANGVTSEVFAKENPNHKEVESYSKHIEDFQMAIERLDLIDQTKKWTGNAAEVGKTYEDHYKPLVDMFKAKGKEVKIIVTDEPVMQEVVMPSGEVVKQEVKALYTRMKDAKDGIATIQINTKKSKGKRTANHEAVHAYTDLMFEGNIKLKEGFTNSLKEALISIKTPNGNLHQDIMEANDINKMDKLEEMMAYGAEYMGKAENAKLGSAFPGMKKFWNKFAKSTLGLEADVTMKQDVIDLMKTIGGTSNLKKLERLNEIIQEDPTGTAREGQVASAEINKTIKQLDVKKAEVLQEINDLKTAQGKTTKFQKEVDAKRDLFNELNQNQKALKNKAEITAVVEKSSKDNDIMYQVDKNYTIGKYKDMVVDGKTIPAKQVFQDQQKNMGDRSVAENIRTSPGLESMIRNQATLMKVPQQYQPKFIKDVKDRIIEKFLKEYDPGKINKEFGRELTPFGWMTTRAGGRPSIMYRAAGDIAGKFKKEVATVSADAQKGGFEAFSGMSDQAGYMNTSKMLESEVQREGIELSESPGMDKALGKIIDQKSGADAKNLDFEAKGAKDIVSYKNIKANAEKTIGKEVTVEYYGTEAKMYSKMLENESQQLNAPDIENILKVVKENIGVEIKMMPRWKQSIIDKISGEEVAFDIVGGKFPSEPKATGTTTSVLKLKDKNGKGLLYKELPQTGTKGSKYEYSDRLLEYHEGLNPVADKKFEQDIIEALGSGNRAEISGKLKGWMMQRKKAMYVQGVDKALPNTPELNARFILAEMANQLTAGKAPGLASKDVNAVTRKLIEDLNKNAKLGKGYSYESTLAILGSDNYKKKFSKDGLKIAKDQLERYKEKLVSVKEQEAIKAKEEMPIASAKEYIANIDFKSKSIQKSMETLSDKLGFKVTEKHLQEAANNTIQKSRFTGKKDGKAVLNRENLKDFREIAAEYFKQFPKDFGITFAKNMIGDPLSGRKNGWHEVIDGKMVEIENTDAILDLNGIYNANVGKNVNPAFEGLNSKYTKGSKISDAFKKATRLAEAGDIAGAKEVMESVLNKSDQKTKQDIYQALGKAQEAVLLSSKNAGDYVKRATFNFDIAKNNSSATEGERILTTTVAVRLKKGERVGLENPLVKELIQEGMKVEDALKKDLPKVEHVKSSLEASFDKGLSVNQLKWSTEGSSLAKKYLGVISSVSRLDKIDVAGLKTNPAGIARMALVRQDLKNNLEFKDGKFTGKTLEDVMMIEASAKLQSVGVKIRSGELKLDYMEFAVNKFLIESSPGMAEVVSQAAKNKSNLKQLDATSKKTLKKLGLGSVASKDINKAIKVVDKALELGRKKNKEAQGMSTFDFDETLIIKGENFVTATKGKETIKISSEKFPIDGPKLAEQGYKFDFKDFANVKGGVEGPLMQKLKNQITKYGNENVFVLTARMQEAAPAIQAWLKSKGVDLAIENITGLGNSTGEAKAMWMLEKFSEGYNDMYFVDDAMPNVKAVRDVLNQLDIKSKVQQALASKDLNKSVNDIMEHSFNIESKKVFSTAEGKVRGKDKKRRKFFMTDSASDLELLMEPMYGKGKKGVANKKWFEENFYKPWERGINDLNTARQTILNDYMGLRKQNKDIVKSLDKAVEGTNFTTDQAARVYIWNKAGFEVPGLTKTSKAKLLEHVANNPKLQAYAESVARLTKIETGLKQPKETWWAETIATEVQETGSTVGREKYIGEWIERKNEIFTEENMAKMESELGPKWREATENMFERMETGKTRGRDLGRIGNEVMNYLNGSVGAIMNLNTRSATLQLISSVNFVNHAENNPYKAAKAFANQPQYWKDFMTIMNSDMLRQRRDGLKINVTEAELAAAVYGKGSKAKKALSWILKQGYLPTKIADSFAISSGGATYYRNRAKMYQKQGSSLKEAEAKAFIDFAAIAEKTQQSSRPDLLSQQQTSFEGRLLLPFANTPMQMNRIMMKEMLDLGKGRYNGKFGQDSFTNKMSKVAYYGFVQSAIFAGLQTGLFALMANSDDDELIANKKARAVNTVADSFLRGMGIPGVVASGVKNAAMAFTAQNEKGFNADYSEVGEALLNMSPTIGSKFSKLDGAGNTYNYNKKEILEKGLSLDNTKGIEAGATVVEAITNVPIARVLRKVENIQGMLDDKNENWQRVLLGLGWGGWSLGGVESDRQEQVERDERKAANKMESKKRSKIKREEKKKVELKEKEAEGVEKQKKEKKEGKKVTCLVCKLPIQKGKKYCTIHEPAVRRKDGKKSQCKKIKKGGKRCGMQTSNKSGFCYYHD